MKRLGYKLQHVYDLSAMPYYLKGPGYPEYSLFPWVVSDFGLVDARPGAAPLQARERHL